MKGTRYVLTVRPSSSLSDHVHIFQIEQQGRRFSSTNRPTDIDRWIKYGRMIADSDIEDLESWERSWWAWWGNLVDGRTVSRGNPSSAVLSPDFSWRVLDVTSSCGLILVMVSLSWWGRAIWKEDVGDSKAQGWRDAVAEVTFALDAIATLKQEDIEKENEEEEEEEDGDGSTVREDSENGRPQQRGSGATSSTKRKRE